MIIVDYSLISYSTIIANVIDNPTLQLNEGLVRHMILNTLRSNYKRFRNEYGPELVIACDSPHSWRKDYFPYYKANRKKKRNDFNIDWDWFFSVSKKILEELKTNFPYRVVKVDTAEGDDVIASLVMNLSDEKVSDKKILILSRDKDFIQLQRYVNVEQFDPITKGFMKVDDPILHLKELIIRGDKTDGIPNFLSPDNCLVIGERQKSIMAKNLPEWLITNDFSDPVMNRNYTRNSVLIDFNYIPNDLRNKILDEYKNECNKDVADKSKIFSYFMKCGLSELMENINDF